MKLLRNLLVVILLVTGWPACLFAQQPGTSDKTAAKFFGQALEYYQGGDLDRALITVARALERDPAFADAYNLRGDILAEQGQAEKAIQSYVLAIKFSKPVNPRSYIILGRLQLDNGYYEDAAVNFRYYLEYKGIPEQSRQVAQHSLNRCEFAISLKENPVPFSPVNLGDSVNSEHDEYVNGITADGEFLYFTRWDVRKEKFLDGRLMYNEDFYIARRWDTVWRKAINLGPPVNTALNEGAMSVSADGSRIFFSACNRDDGYGRCDIYQSERTAEGWSEPENLGEDLNSEEWDSQPCFSSDGKTLYFASNRRGGKGSSDLWKSEMKPDGTWTIPENLGDSINSPNEEMAPYIHPDGQTLYFSSRGHPGMGGMDLFISRRTGDHWSKPVNLGYPINTHADEVTLIVETNGNLAYISSDKLGGSGKQDIYRFELPPSIRPVATTYFKGIVYDEPTGNRLGANFELYDLAGSAMVAQSKSDPYTGEFLLVLPSDRNYALSVSKPGYLFYSDNFMLSGAGTVEMPFVKDIPLKPIRVGEVVVLKNIFFDTDQYTLKPESITELKKLLLLLQQNESLKIEISGHTDNVGTAAYNRELSHQRAKAVYNYLISSNIRPDRLTYQGYGFDRPVDTNETEQGRAGNRRTEFKIIGN